MALFLAFAVTLPTFLVIFEALELNYFGPKMGLLTVLFGLLAAAV